MSEIKVVEALKMLKDIQERKIPDLTRKIRKYSAHMEDENPEFETEDSQQKKIDAWKQSVLDCIKLIEKLTIAIQTSNLNTELVIILDGNEVTKTVAEWIIERRKCANLKKQLWSSFDKSTLAGRWKKDEKGKDTDEPIKIKKYYNSTERDVKIELYASEPSIIDAKLEVCNAKTGLEIPD